ncbi:MAG: HigA family addiction module antitoxin [Candidatus Nanopelagicales bacterium]
MTEQNRLRRGSFLPNYAVHPGEFISEWLEQRGMTQVELADRIALSTKQLNQIIRGHKPITQETALKLEAVTSIAARFWNSAQALYEEDVARIAGDAELTDHVSFLGQVPVAALRKAGHVSKSSLHDKLATLKEVLAFFGVAHPDAWERLWMAPAAAFRRSAAFAERPGATATWLRVGELAASGVDAPPFDANRLKAILPGLRSLSTMPAFDNMLANAKDLCAMAGVLLVVVPDIFGARCSGATRWIGGRPVVQLSMRFRKDDQFWFTLFHELGHVLLHPRNEVFIDEGVEDEARKHMEAEADHFATETLIPSDVSVGLRELRSQDAIVRFAEHLEIAPGIVVGRLQHDGIVPHTHFNRLKRTYALPSAA